MWAGYRPIVDEDIFKPLGQDVDGSGAGAGGVIIDVNTIANGANVGGGNDGGTTSSNGGDAGQGGGFVLPANDTSMDGEAVRPPVSDRDRPLDDGARVTGDETSLLNFNRARFEQLLNA